MMVRAAVLKMKDPRQIIRDMEKLDEMGEGVFFLKDAKLIYEIVLSPLIFFPELTTFSFFACLNRPIF